ncbi:MAG: hypothetical protein JWR17_3160 [Pseudomonas sp.]|jgi:hypothetical protein|nr:hypothetical protein [Pseudomonas sp.]
MKASMAGHDKRKKTAGSFLFLSHSRSQLVGEAFYLTHRLANKLAPTQQVMLLRRVGLFALVLGLEVGVADDFKRCLANRLAVQEGVDLGVGHAV